MFLYLIIINLVRRKMIITEILCIFSQHEKNIAFVSENIKKQVTFSFKANLAWQPGCLWECLCCLSLVWIIRDDFRFLARRGRFTANTIFFSKRGEISINEPSIFTAFTVWWSRKMVCYLGLTKTKLKQ